MGIHTRIESNFRSTTPAPVQTQCLLVTKSRIRANRHGFTAHHKTTSERTIYLAIAVSCTLQTGGFAPSRSPLKATLTPPQLHAVHSGPVPQNGSCFEVKFFDDFFSKAFLMPLLCPETRAPFFSLHADQRKFGFPS